MIDFLNPDATRMHFQHIVDRLRSELGDISKSSLKYLEVDSVELNENVLGHINYGVKDMDVLVANGDGQYHKVLSCVLNAGPENEDRDYAQDVALAAKGVRFVRFDVKSNHNRPNYSDGVGKFVGLSKIVFFASQPIDGVTIESVSSGSVFAPRSDNFLGEVHVDAELQLAASGTTFLRAWRPGTYTLVNSLGQRHPVNVADVPEPMAITGAWQVHFTPGWARHGCNNVRSTAFLDGK